MTLLRVIAINYFGAAWVEGLLRSLQEQRHQDWRLVLVDNSESEDQGSRLREICVEEERAEVLISSSNLGYLRAAEWARLSQPSEATWTAVCNTDLQLDDHRFVALLSDLRPDRAVLAPEITAVPSLRKQNPYMVARPSVRRMLFRRLMLSHELSARLALAVATSRERAGQGASEATARDIYAPHGSFMLFHRDFFSRGGSLRHGSFLFGEEITIGERARQLGLRVGYEPSLRVLHEEHQATGRKRTGVLFRAQRDAAIYGHRLIAGKEPVG
jgi:GT2 family glycosyltransferase